jgi:hypothetical protein
MGNLTPERYAKAHEVNPVVFERWIRAHLIFRREAGGPKGTDLAGTRSKPSVARAEFVGMTFAGEESPC